MPTCICISPEVAISSNVDQCTGQGKVREIQGQGKVREFQNVKRNLYDKKKSVKFTVGLGNIDVLD